MGAVGEPVAELAVSPRNPADSRAIRQRHIRLILFGSIAATGVALRLWQYLTNASLWVDEAALARNIVDRSPGALFAPLDYGQVAPWGFLLVEKAAVTTFGNNELALRLFPFICGLLTLALVYLAASRILGTVGVAVALAICAAGLPFVYFPSQAKPYSCDIAACLFVLLLAVRCRQPPRQDWTCSSWQARAPRCPSSDSREAVGAPAGRRCSSPLSGPPERSRRSWPGAAA